MPNLACIFSRNNSPTGKWRVPPKLASVIVVNENALVNIAIARATTPWRDGDTRAVESMSGQR